MDERKEVALQAMRDTTVGKRIQDVSFTRHGECIRQTFDDGSYSEWYWRLYRATVKQKRRKRWNNRKRRS